MSATTAGVQVPRWGRPRTVFAWCGAALYPVVPYQVVETFPDGFNLVANACCVLLTLLVFALMRRHPWPAFGLLLLGWFSATVVSNAGMGTNLLLQVLVTDLAVTLITAEQSRRSSLIAAAVAVLVQFAAVLVRVQGGGLAHTDQLVAGSLVLAVAVAWMAGSSVRVRREHAAALQAWATEQAVTAERLRIARELHDVVAHSIGVIAIQAGAGSRVIGTQPDAARDALSAIEATSRETLSGLRRMLGALRHAEPGEGVRPSPLDPAPGLADVQRLVAAAKDAGVQVDVHWLGERRALPAELDLSAFRIIQEAVTNVVRHAGTDRCRVTVEYREDEVTVEIVDEGRGGEPADGQSRDTTVRGGHGIVGMRERASLLHGHFEAGPRPEGGFRVRARLPLPGAGR